MSKPSKNPQVVEVHMRHLTEEEYAAAPEAVRKVYIAALEYIPMDQDEKRKTINAYPEYFTLKEKKVKKSFGQNFKRMSNLKMHKDSITKRVIARSTSLRGTKQSPNDKSFGINGMGLPHSVAFAKKEDVEFPPIPEEQKEFIRNLKKY